MTCCRGRWRTGRAHRLPPGRACAPEVARIAPLALAHGRPSVPAAVEQDVNLAVLVPRENDRFCTDARGLVVSWLRDLARMSHIDPGAAENMLHLRVEYGGVRVDIRPHATVFNKTAEVSTQDPIDVIHPDRSPRTTFAPAGVVPRHARSAPIQLPVKSTASLKITLFYCAFRQRQGAREGVGTALTRAALRLTWRRISSTTTRVTPYVCRTAAGS